MVKSNEFLLDEKHFINENHNKHQILLMDSHCGGMSHYKQWLKKNPVGYKYTTPYTVSLDGIVHEHYQPHFGSKIFGIKEIDKGIIPITLENEGCLTFDGKKKKFITWSGDIYQRDKDDVHVQKWRGGLFWAPYTPEQLEALGELVIELTQEHNIELKVKDVENDNIFVENYQGIVMKNDYNILSRDINPNFNRINFKEIINKL